MSNTSFACQVRVEVSARGRQRTIGCIQESVELSRHTWTAAIRLAVVISIIAAVAAVVVSSVGNVPQAAIVLPVIVVAFTASWVQTNRNRRAPAPLRLRTPVTH